MGGDRSSFGQLGSQLLRDPLDVTSSKGRVAIRQMTPEQIEPVSGRLEEQIYEQPDRVSDFEGGIPFEQHGHKGRGIDTEYPFSSSSGFAGPTDQIFIPAHLDPSFSAAFLN